MDGKPIESETAAEKADGVPSAATETAAAAPAAPVEDELLDAYEPLRNDIIAALKTVYDPEIPSDIYELGLIYGIDIDAERNVTIAMTLTAPGLPGGRRDAQMGRERRQCGARRQQHDGHHDLRPALGHEPHVGRGTARPQHVLILKDRRFTKARR